MSKDIELEVYRQVRESEKKYFYFLLASVGACIGFALTQTKNMPLSYSQIPLAFALLCWGISFWQGCRYISELIEALHLNRELLHVQKGRSELAGTDPKKINIEMKLFIEKIQKIEKSAFRSRTIQFWTLVIGVIGYIIWHILNMWANTL